MALPSPQVPDPQSQLNFDYLKKKNEELEEELTEAKEEIEEVEAFPYKLKRGTVEIEKESEGFAEHELGALPKVAVVSGLKNEAVDVKVHLLAITETQLVIRNQSTKKVTVHWIALT